MDEADGQHQTREPKSIDGRPVPPPPQVDWPRATRPPRVEDFIKDLNDVSILPRFRF